MSIEDPTHHEAPLIALLKTDFTALDDDQAKAKVDEIRQLRSVPAKRNSAVNKSTKATKAHVDISDLL